MAYCRTFTDIPFSKQIFDELLKVREVRKTIASFAYGGTRISLVPSFETRYRLTDRLISENGSKQIVEIAAGLSPRGLSMSGNPLIRFVEVDLPEVMRRKRKIVDNILKRSKNGLRSNLRLESGNALNLSDLRNATKYFKDEPIAVISEGLLRYLNFKEQALLAKNIHALLSKFGGVWIVPIITRATSKNPLAIKRGSEIIGRDISKNMFENPKQARVFFAKLGFTIEQRSGMEVAGELVSPQRLGLLKEYVEKRIRPITTFVLRRRSGSFP
ncbi:MAG: class I SAM-dependent methyltransferase [Parcubacteria group bacterium]|nr:class I SAM-dependent methyltransferase [Parcubacteria group bacterium]